MPAADVSGACARGGDTKRRAQSVAAALTAARHHSAGSWEKVVTRREERQEGEVHEEYDGLRAQTTPLPGVRPAPLSEVAGPQAAVTVGYVAAGPSSLVVALLAVHDMWTRPRCSSPPPTVIPGTRVGGGKGEGGGRGEDAGGRRGG